MTEAQIKAFLAICDKMDIRKFNSVELGVAFTQLKNEILVGLRRKGQKVREDGGVEAIDTNTKPINWNQFKKIKPGSKVIYGSYGGTNWVTGLAFKLDNKIIEQRLHIKSFTDKKKRVYSSREEYSDMIAYLIKDAVAHLDKKNVSTLAISFGIPQINIITNYGVDAIGTSDYFTKSWYIKNGKGMYLGKNILQSLKKLGLDNFTHTYFTNDTTAVSLDVSSKSSSSKSEQLVSLPVGFVMGTGDNGSAIFEGYKNNNLVNLELGSALSIGTDQILKMMIKEKIVPTGTPLLEYYVGGDYLLERLAMAIKLLQTNNFLSRDYFKILLLNAKEAKITSRLASMDITVEELSLLLKTKVNTDDLFILNEVAKRILAKGAQVAGVMVASVCDLAGWGRGIYGAVPVEGTVFWQGYRFQERVKKTLKTLLPFNKLTFVPGSGTRGIATEAMIKN